ncbi:cytochrome P450, partial [Wolfiporia cocos MD-104 SS10]
IHSIPTIGHSLPVLSYYSAFRFLRNARQMVEEGYARHKVFKIATWDRWMVYVSGPEMNDELRRLPGDVASIEEAIDEWIYTEYSFGAPEHDLTIPTIHSLLVRDLSGVIPTVADEVGLVFEELFPQESDWVELTNLPNFLSNVVARIVNRVFIGAPVCREPGYLKIVTNYASDVIKAKIILDLFPKLLKPLIGNMLPWRARATRHLKHHLSETIADRQLSLDEYGNGCKEKPDDFLMRIVKGARDLGGSMESILINILMANFTAVHTSSATATATLFHIASQPESIAALREDVLSATRAEGWTRGSINSMWKLDSFLKETLRWQGLSIASLRRKALKTVTFSDGTVVPAGVHIYAAPAATHRDSTLYEDADTFKPFRFSDKREQAGQSAKHQLVNTSPEYIVFGHGKHACPGRFFAAIVIKIFIANLLLKYDVKMGGDGSLPENVMIGASAMLSSKAKVLFRRRQVVDA